MEKRDVAVHLQNVRLSLEGNAGEVNILRGINLELFKGESVGLVGPSGAGKSTLLMVVAGLEGVDEGGVIVAGEDLCRLDEDGLARFRRDHVGIVFQSFHLVSTMTALENVMLPLEFAGVADADARAREELGLVGLEHRLNHYPGELSGGEQQRVALARALVGEPDILLADEPTGNLDGASGGIVMDLLFGACDRKGSSLLLITHDEGLARRCGRVVRMADGRVV
ncbi:MAG: ABC transporter ATP-binding protein [Hyphomicrobiales bacterium]|nr:ABC transporter ATP-binding protein [Hyphomicrobiales bacterium]MCY4033551.1 ABC transporter ATP-binding protein [Hyphomicrobiales bacterium]MCY4039086.1 ABC transporter ATP-binding protein [Hyphomicrobiales bacterium]